MLRLQGKVCIITGAAGAMGAAATRLFRAEGASVIAADIDDSAGALLAEDASSDAGRVIFIRADVTDEADCRMLTEEAMNRFSKLDVLYNNAGIMPSDDRSVTETSLETWRRVHAVNVESMFLCSKYAVPAMIASGGGSVVNISSFVAFMGCTVPQDAYTASKGAMVSLTRSMAVQFGPRGVRTNAICPGPIETPLSHDLIAEPEARAVRLPRIPLRRFGLVEDVIPLALHLASDESSWTNGAVIIVDGGISCNYF